VNETLPVFANLECRTLLEMVAGYAIILDSTGRIDWTNRAPVGASVDDYIKTPLDRWIIADQRPVVCETVASVVAGAPPTTLELRSEITGRWYSAQFQRLSRRGSADGVFVHAVDIDDVKREKAALAIRRPRIQAPATESDPAAELRRFELMADALPVLISYVDSQRRYQYNNAAYERWFVTSREDLRGRDLETVVGPAAYANSEVTWTRR
jgi:PAS domain-containing protein